MTTEFHLHDRIKGLSSLNFNPGLHFLQCVCRQKKRALETAAFTFLLMLYLTMVNWYTWDDLTEGWKNPQIVLDIRS